MKQSSLAIQEFLENCSNEVYHNPERPQQVLGNLTRKYGNMTNVRQNLTAFLADISLLEGRIGTDIRDTLNILLCADCSTFLCIFRQFLALFPTFFNFRVFFAFGADGEVACHSQEHLKPCSQCTIHTKHQGSRKMGTVGTYSQPL